MTSSSNQTDKLWSLLEGQGLPTDDRNHHAFLRPLVLRPETEEARGVIEDFVVRSSVGKSRGVNQLAKFRLHWQYVLLNLCTVLFQHRWLIVSLDQNAYSQDEWLKLHGLSYSCMRDVISYLEAEGLIEIIRGRKYANDPSRTRLYPKSRLSGLLKGLFGLIEEEIRPPYISINAGVSRWKETIAGLSSDHNEVVEMTTINNFLKDHEWTCKAPVRLVYKSHILNGGRLITPFQNLPDKKVRIRINTLIDQQPICEVDFSANHLRLNLAFNAKEYAGDSPYEDIGAIAKLDNRDQIKDFMTVAMGASTETEARKALYQKGFNDDLIDRIKEATQERFPKLGLFSGWGIYAQNFEGQIIKDVLLQGVAQGIVCLPVHDAIAVQRQHAEWAKEVMLETWSRHMDGVKTMVKFDMAAPSVGS